MQTSSAAPPSTFRRTISKLLSHALAANRARYSFRNHRLEIHFPHRLSAYGSEQIAQGSAAGRIAQVRREFQQSLQDEAAGGEMLVRDDQRGRADHEIAVKENIDVDRARALRHQAAAPQPLLDFTDAGQQLHWKQG